MKLGALAHDRPLLSMQVAFSNNENALPISLDRTVADDLLLCSV